MLAMLNGTNEVDASLDGWWLVDTIDGRRWIGKCVDEMYKGKPIADPSVPGAMTLQPAFEVPPDRALVGLVIPQQTPMGIQVTPTAVPMSSFQIAHVANRQGAGTPPWRVRWASRMHLADWGAEVRKEIAGILTSLVKQAVESRPVEFPTDRTKVT